MTDIGRNDPCPCGSGVKYKYCCLRKKKKGAANDDLRDDDGWQLRLAQAINQGYEARQRKNGRQAIDIWLHGWQQVRKQIPAEISTLAALERECHGDRSLVSWFWGLVDLLRNTARDDATVAQPGADFLAQSLAKFPGESEDNQRNMRADRGWLLAAAGRWDEANEEFERLIDDFPDHAAGYATWADAVIEYAPDQGGRAVEILQRAVDRPVDDGADWSLRARLDDARRFAGNLADRVEDEPQEGDAADTDGDENDLETIEDRRNAFWDRFDAADLDEQFEMGADAIKDEAWFDGEDAFYLLVDCLEGPAREHNRHEQWLELFDTLRDRRAEILRGESVFLGRAALRIAVVVEDEQRVEQAVDMLFKDPGPHIELFVNALPKLAYHGFEGTYPRLCDAWSQEEKPGGMVGWAGPRWAEWMTWFLLANWADDDINRVRDVDELHQALGGIFDKLNVEVVREAIHRFFGPDAADVDADTIAGIDDRQQRSAAIGFGFGRHLIDELGWNSPKALLGARGVNTFLNHCAGVNDPFGDRHTTDKARKSKLLKRELKQLRKPWKNGGQFAPHPDLAVGYAETLLYQGQFGQPYSAAAFFEAVVRLAPWMEKRGFIDDTELVDQIQHHFRRRIASLSKRILKYVSSDPVVARGLEDAEQWVTKGR